MSDQQIPGAGEGPDEPTTEFGRVDRPEPTLNLGRPEPTPNLGQSETLDLGQPHPPAQQPSPSAAQPQSAPLFPPPSGPPPYGFTPPPPAKPAKARVPGWLWPTVTVVALLVGIAGGALGSYAYDEYQGDDTIQRYDDGLSDIDNVSLPPLPDDNNSVAAVAQKMLPTTVQIQADFEGEGLGATGSGFVLDDQNHVVTNNHVVADAAENDGEIRVVDHEGNRYDATVVGRSPVYDLAVLQVDDLPDDMEPAALGRSETLRIGEAVVAIGSPLGLSSTVTSGIVSALNRPVTTGSDSEDVSSFINAIQTDAAINPGNSGGPLVNLRGQVVGVNSAIATTGGIAEGEAGNIGVGFAIPIEQVRITADQIIRDGEAQYPIIGATVDSDGSGDGAHIQEVEDGSPAEEGGLESGDVVTALNGQQVTDSPTLIVLIRSHLPGETVQLTVDRDGDERTIQVTLGAKVG